MCQTDLIRSRDTDLMVLHSKGRNLIVVGDFVVVYSGTIKTLEFEEGGRREREREKEGRVGVVREGA